jgi:hypothetical protein
MVKWDIRRDDDKLNDNMVEQVADEGRTGAS